MQQPLETILAIAEGSFQGHRTRSTITRVLPVPAPAITTTGPSPHSTIRRCSAVSPMAEVVITR